MINTRSGIKLDPESLIKHEDNQCFYVNTNADYHSNINHKSNDLFNPSIKFKIEDKIFDNPLYERIREDRTYGYKKELEEVLSFFNKEYDYNKNFDNRDFKAIEVKKVTFENGSWIPHYDISISNPDNKKDHEICKYKTHTDTYSICSCGHLCSSLYLIKNIVTNVYFGVGCDCIRKFVIDGEIFANNLKKLKSEYKKRLCDICHEVTDPSILKKNKIKNNKFCNKCIKSVKVIFDIKYKEKDEYKKYGIRWDCNSRYWYMNGVINKMLIDKIDKIEFEEQYNFIEDSDED